ncbi:E3 ubiquitin-protein ligase TRIM33-like [Amphiura filiformis]|uniref:E3 ubiquitin-protein ligase TRIM33-like n=1 Tax=Amphiura filiformis TaxID=82378 RepID=UPI003B21BA27
MASENTDPPASEPEVVQVQEEKPAEDLGGLFSPFCRVCNNELASREPKLMPCLHTVCKQCVDNLTNRENKTARCPICRQECRNLDDIIDNNFMMGKPIPVSAEATTSSENAVCTNCDDNATVSAWCQDCQEWLCEDCVKAHHRVRVTKDHVIRSKEEVDAPDSGAAQPEALRSDIKFFCRIHKQEPLKLYCETCDKLTCRDCQLLEHKEHRYQFISEAAIRQKAAMKVLLNKLQEKHSYVIQTRKHIRDKKLELIKNEQKVTQEIKTLVYKLVTEINNRGKRLITELSTACEARRKVFDQQMQEIERLERTIQHCYKFTEQAAASDNDSALLCSRKLIVQQLVLLLRTMCTRQPVAGLDIRFLRNEQNMMNLVGRLGMLVIRDPLNKNNPSQQAAAAAAAQALAAAQGRSGMQNLSPSQQQAIIKEQQQRINLHQLMMRRQNSESGNVQQANGPQMYLQAAPQMDGTQVLRHINGPQIRPTNGPQGGPTFTSRASSYTSSPNSGMIQLSPTPPNQVLVRPVSHPNMIPPSSQHGPRPSSIPQMMMQRTGSGEIILSGSSTPSSPPIISPPSDVEVIKVKDEPKTPMDERPSCSMAGRLIPGLEGDRQKTTGSVHSEPHQRPTSIPTSEGGGSTKSEGAQPQDKSNPNSAKQEPLPIQISCVFGGTNGTNETGGKGEHQMALYNTYEPVNQDPNEDWCACCHNGGELLCCDSCPRVYHLNCHIPVLTATPTDSDAWCCTMCVDLENDPAEASSDNGNERKRRVSSGLTNVERKKCEKIGLEIFCLDQSVPFHKPVSKAHVPDYYKVVSQPMQLSTIKSKLQPVHFNHYQNVEEFVTDMRLMFSNCYLYNGEMSEMGKIGKAVEEHFNQLLQKYFPNDQYHLQTGRVTLLLSDSERSDASTSEERPPQNKRKRKPEDIMHYPPQQ